MSSRLPKYAKRAAVILARLLAAAACLAATACRGAAAADGAAPADSRPGVWFRGDFESGNLTAWSGDLARAESARVVTRPVRRGRYAVCITLAPGDIAASKQRAELKVADKDIERRHGGQGGDLWYGWSLLIPVDYADPPGDAFQILGQWHHRPAAGASGKPAPKLAGPPPLALYLVHAGAAGAAGRHVLVLIGQPSPRAAPRHLGERLVRLGAWIDLVFHLHASTGDDGFVEAWADDQPFTRGRIFGPTLYTPVSNYLRLGLYRAKGVATTNRIYYDEVRIGSSHRAVLP